MLTDALASPAAASSPASAAVTRRPPVVSVTRRPAACAALTSVTKPGCR